MKWFFGFLIAASFTIPSQLRYNANVTGSVSRPIASKEGDVFSVCDWIGQVCPSGGDDTVKFQAAVTAAAAAKAALLIPKGDYSLTAEITVPTNSHIMGTGIESHVYWTGAAINSGFNADNASDVVIEGLYFEGKTSPSNALTRCIEATGVTRLTIQNSKFTGCGAADRVSGYRGAITTDGTDIIIENNYFTGNGPGTVGADSHEINFSPTAVPASWTVTTQRAFVRRNRITGNTSNLSIAIHDAYDVEVSENYIDQNNTKTINNSGYGIMCYSTAATPTTSNACKRIRVENNYITNTAGIGIYFAGVVDGVIAGNMLRDVVKQQLEVDINPAGITLNQFFTSGTAGGVTVSGNSIDTTGQAGISCAQCVGESITGNVIQFPAVYGIDVRGTSTDTTVVGNTVLGTQAASQTGIAVRTSSTRITVDGNSIQSMYHGINLVGVNDCLAVNNRVNNTLFHGIQASSTSARDIIARNQVTNSGGFGVAEGSLTNYYYDNYLVSNASGPYNLNTGSFKNANIVSSGGLPVDIASRIGLTYSATIATDASLGNAFSISASNGTAFTISNPTNLWTGQRVLYTIRNTSGGVLGAITWGTTFKINATAIAPANATSRSIEFLYDGTNLVEIGRGTLDVPN